MKYYFIRNLENHLYLRWDERVLVFTEVEKATDCLKIISEETEFDLANAVITEEELPAESVNDLFWLDPVLNFKEEEDENNI